jgi:hypothetical protein
VALLIAGYQYVDIKIAIISFKHSLKNIKSHFKNSKYNNYFQFNGLLMVQRERLGVIPAAVG